MVGEMQGVESRDINRVEAPHLLFKGVTRLVVNTLPDYVPKQLKEELIASHPDPDIRFQKLKDTDSRDVHIPEYIKQRDRLAYQVGLGFLNEVVTQSLAIEMLQDRIDIAKAAHKIPTMADSFIEMFTGEGAFPLNDKNVGLIHHLQLAYLSGKRSELDEYLKSNYGYTGLEDFAVKMGWAVLSSQKNKSNVTDSPINDSDQVGGMMSREFPGRITVDLSFVQTKAVMVLQTVIALALTSVAARELTVPHSPENQAILLGITTLSAVTTSIIGYLGARNAKEVINTTIGLGFHEIVHYLSTDFSKKRTGFIHYV